MRRTCSASDYCYFCSGVNWIRPGGRESINCEWLWPLGLQCSYTEADSNGEALHMGAAGYDETGIGGAVLQCFPVPQHVVGRQFEHGETNRWLWWWSFSAGWVGVEMAGVLSAAWGLDACCCTREESSFIPAQQLDHDSPAFCFLASTCIHPQ